MEGKSDETSDWQQVKHLLSLKAKDGKAILHRPESSGGKLAAGPQILSRQQMGAVRKEAEATAAALQSDTQLEASRIFEERAEVSVRPFSPSLLLIFAEGVGFSCRSPPRYITPLGDRRSKLLCPPS